VSVPAGEAEWRALVRAGQVAYWREMVVAARGAELYERDKVVASVFSTAPERSVFNSVFYGDSDELLARLEEIAAVYERAGVRAWTVWVPEEDRATAEQLEAAGHALDATPRDMAIALEDLRAPGGGGEEDLREEYDPEGMARLNETAYGYAEGEFAPVARAEMRGLRIYFADLGGEPVATLGVWAHGEDGVVAWVATLPEARGRGIAGRLLARALADGRKQGLRTSTLQATKLGYPVYAKLGYRDVGTMQMWERRSG